MGKDKHVIIGCTIMPGYIHSIAKHLLRDCENVTISYNPEFIQQGDIIRGFLNPDMVLIGEGCTEMCARTPLSWAAWLLKVLRSANSQSTVSSQPRYHTATWLVTLPIAHLAQRRTRSCRLSALILASAPSVCVLDTDSEALASLATTVPLVDTPRASASTQRFQLQLTSTTTTTPRS